MQGMGKGACEELTTLQSLPSPSFQSPPLYWAQESRDGQSVQAWVKTFDCCCSLPGPHTPPGAGTLQWGCGQFWRLG